MKGKEHKETGDKYSLRGKVYDRIREDILNGVYKEQEELKEATLGEKMGVSRTPVREALRQLELEGLVEIIPNKGARVTGITKKDIDDIYQIRYLLEGLSARWATEHVTEEQIDKMEETLYLTEFHAKKGNYTQVYDLDSQFHELMYEASGSKMLNHILSDFHMYVTRIRKTSLASDNRSKNSTDEHRAILDAIKERNADKAEECAHNHVLSTIKNNHEHGL
ncbi:MAG: GntR family transcriptional regulator [Lachnospiraceae bacterium]|nr:GntR family transcriptional regulator [Lachnospiraceae bacterium]